MKTRTVTVGGLPGTGTSTLCKLLEPALELPYTYAGQLFRDEAKARGLSLAQFGALCQQDPAVDQVLDDTQIKLLRQGGIILEGRLSGHLAQRASIPAFKVWIVCDDDERIRRITERDGSDAETQRAATLARESSESDRYRRYYGIDLSDLTPYDLVLDSTDRTPEELRDDVVAALRTV